MNSTNKAVVTLAIVLSVIVVSLGSVALTLVVRSGHHYTTADLASARSTAIRTGYDQGNAAGVITGTATGLTKGFKHGKTVGYAKGVDAGIAQQTATDLVEQSANQVDYDSGYTAGCQSVFDSMNAAFIWTSQYGYSKVFRTDC